jgi:hypothetical protein
VDLGVLVTALVYFKGTRPSRVRLRSDQDVGIKKAMTCFLMHRLPPEEQATMVADVIAWQLMISSLVPAAIDPRR